MKRRLIGLQACILALLITAGCNSRINTVEIKPEETDMAEVATEKTDDAASASETSRDIFAMDTYMTVTAYGEQSEAAVTAAEAEIERLDSLLSTGDTESEIYKLNQNGSAVLSEDASYLVERAIELNEETDGAFDIAIYPVMEAWGFPTQNYQVPSEETIQLLLPLTDASEMLYEKDSRKISFGKEGMKIDLGGIAKGYTSARIIDIFKEYDISSAMVNLGGNVQVLGTKTDGNLWRIAIQNPDDEEDYLGILSVRDKAVITSGGYERFFEQDGKTYHHIIDPETGYPAENGLTSVTIVSTDGTLADGLSTSLFIMGKEKAAEFWKEHSEEFDAILLTEDGTLYVTEGIENDFSTDFSMEVIRK